MNKTIKTSFQNQNINTFKILYTIVKIIKKESSKRKWKNFETVLVTFY